MEPIELFLSPADEGGQTLENGLDGNAIGEIDVDEAKKTAKAEQFPDPGGDPNSLMDQGWGVVIPDNDRGSRLLELIKPLIDKRLEDMDADDVKVYRVPAGLNAPDALRWRDEAVIGNNDLYEIPGYMLVLGDLDGVSIETQQALSTQYNVGRVGFDKDAHYESYVDKLLRWEDADKSGEARAIFFSAMDGTPATRIGDSLLIRPTVQDSQEQMDEGKLPVSEVLHLFDEEPADAGDLLLENVGGEQPSILFTCSHGMGAPRRGWNSFDRQRALQGAMCLGAGEHIDAGAVAEIPFLPGGMWMFFACFGAGTPAVSEYRHWLSRLKKVGQFSSGIDGVLASLPKDNDPPFIASLPKAVLANPNGPLTVIGHIDLAWSYSFQALDGESSQARDSRFRPIIKEMARGSRAGISLRPLLLSREQAKDELVASADMAARAAEEGTSAPDDRKRIGHKWMMHQDLNGYVLLGDPAARMAVKPKKRKRNKTRKAATPDIRSSAPVPAESAAPAPSPAGAPAPAAPAPADTIANKSTRSLQEGQSIDGQSEGQSIDGPQSFGWFGKDGDDGEKEPGFFAKFTQKVTQTLGSVLEDAATLEIKTYTGDDVQTAPSGDKDMSSHPNIRLHAYTRSKLDGDVEQFWALNPEGDTEQDRNLRSLHLEMVKHAQEHRNELLKILLSLLRPGAQ